MTLDLYIDVTTGRAQLDATDTSPAGPISLFLRDIVPMTITFLAAGENVTTAILTAGTIMRLGLKTPVLGSTLLAGATDYTVVDGAADITFSLNTNQLIDFFASNVGARTRGTELLFEIEVEAADGSTRQTFFQSFVLVSKDVNDPTDLPTTDAGDEIYVRRDLVFDANGLGAGPQFLNFRPDVTGETGGGTNLDGVATASLKPPLAFLTYFGGVLRVYVLLTSSAATGPGIIQPLDNAALRWIQLGID